MLLVGVVCLCWAPACHGWKLLQALYLSHAACKWPSGVLLFVAGMPGVIPGITTMPNMPNMPNMAMFGGVNPMAMFGVRAPLLADASPALQGWDSHDQSKQGVLPDIQSKAFALPTLSEWVHAVPKVPQVVFRGLSLQGKPQQVSCPGSPSMYPLCLFFSVFPVLPCIMPPLCSISRVSTLNARTGGPSKSPSSSWHESEAAALGRRAAGIG